MIPLGEFSDSLHLEPGQIIEFTLPNGQSAPGRVEQVDDQEAVVDVNHPGAGRDLSCRAEILSVENR